MIGRWIDSLTDAERDRIIEHPDPAYSGGLWWASHRDCGCLVGCVLWTTNAQFDAFLDRVIAEDVETLSDAIGQWYSTAHAKAGMRFPHLTRRFTPERMWRLVKARAAKANRVVIPAVAEEATLA